MTKCLNCGAEIKQKEGARERRFCDNKNKCKQAYHNKKNGSGYKPKKKHISFEEYEKLMAMASGGKKSEPEVKVISAKIDKQKRVADILVEVESDNQPQKHKLWKKGDPPEKSNAFFLRYDCWSYDELEKLKK